MNRMVSVVLPTYNGEKYLSQSIDSVLAQTYSDWELIIIDDGSTDRTEEIARSYADKDKRITYYKNPKNIQLPRSLNRGFAMSVGEYLTWTSDDNVYYPDAFETMVKTLESDRELGFVFSSCDVIDADGKKVDEWIMPENMELRQIMGTNIVGACFMYTRRVYAIVGDYNPSLFLAEDFDYWQRIFANFKVKPIEKTLYAYRRHAENLTSTRSQDEISRICERAILKNANLYSKLDLVQKYYLHEGLNRNRQTSSKDPDFYLQDYTVYKNLHLLTYRLPRKIKRLIKKS